MVFAAIGHLRKVNISCNSIENVLTLQAQISPIKPPSRSWFNLQLRKYPFLYTIKTKPIEYKRLASHIEANIKEWVEKYEQICVELEVKYRKYIYNIDEAGCRIGCLTREKVIVSIEVLELYIKSPENQKSLTIIELINTFSKTV